MANEFITKGTKLSYKTGGETYTELKGLKSTPDMASNKETIEVTDLSDSSKRYINGIADYGDGLEFTFNRLNSAEDSYAILQPLEAADTTVDFKLEYPDGLTFVFSAQISTTIKGAEVNGVGEFTAKLTPTSAFTITLPTHA